MKEFAKRMVGVALTTTALVAPLTVGATAASAASFSPAINPVPCDHSEYLVVTMHKSGLADDVSCFANAGEYQLESEPIQKIWVTRISTGNNRVQWYGDGRWQPDTPIGKNTVFTWPHYPGGVVISSIRIL